MEAAILRALRVLLDPVVISRRLQVSNCRPDVGKENDAVVANQLVIIMCRIVIVLVVPAVVEGGAKHVQTAENEENNQQKDDREHSNVIEGPTK